MSAQTSRRWHPVALSSQIPSGAPVRVPCGNGDLAMFRDGTGTCRAVADQCAHRRAPLSQGRLTEDFLIECPYHGWRYEGVSGACVAIPNLRGDEKIPKHYRVRSYETTERGGFVQVLLGEGAGTPPDPIDIPNLGRQWEGERLLAYPEELLMDTLVDSPSALVSITGIEILDDHPLGDPIVGDGQLTIDYAGSKARRTRRPRKTQAADFAYTIRISASRTMARVSLLANDDERLLAAAFIAGVGDGKRITRALWRGTAPTDSDRTISVRPYIDARPVRASRHVASQSWAGTIGLTAA